MHTIAAPESLNTEEQDVVRVAARNSGKLAIENRSDTRGHAVRAGNEKLYNPQNPDYAKNCCEAVSQLIEMQLLRTGDGPKQYELTNFGWQLSRKLTTKSNEEDQNVSHEEVLSPTIPTESIPSVSANAATWTSSKTESPEALISALGLDDSFLPEEPSTLEETGLNATFVEDLILKIIQTAGSLTGKQISDRICLRVAIIEDLFTNLRKRQYVALTGSAMLGDHIYQLTDQGRERAREATQECAYSGPAPVPLDDYAASVQAQTIRTEKPKRDRLEKAFSDINVEPEMLAKLGPAISAGKGMFIYGPPGNGKTTVAQRITRCFGQNILVPHAIIEDGQIIKFFDASCHVPVESSASKLINTSNQDRRWIRIRRPTVVVGGELTMDSLELNHDPISHVSGASLQLKSNCGSLLIDDFGRQQIDPTSLLNRWIVPLENRIDYLSLANGKKIEVPFEQLIIFSTNLEPSDLADDAFLRRIPFKIEVGAPSRQEFSKLFEAFASKSKIECTMDKLEYLVSHHYDSCDRPLRRCHARDLLDQVAHYCEYNELPMVATTEILDHAVNNYFTAMSGKE
ncbi:AAA family ATPase [Bythopirellula polymerisocia]|uniref:AAA+ ATPase domain-containing protein n=1 Tax=Bythopirellula polymerisocia TaxID=2528003 RepID=A0A5C6CCY1_9BACT|nr:AAA family ATPase [Bythopirellula polymerisocia]TWU21905.1 hypothetical protein Pla144_43400 [Bythopirellula polymerisocia]